MNHESLEDRIAAVVVSKQPDSAFDRVILTAYLLANAGTQWHNELDELTADVQGISKPEAAAAFAFVRQMLPQVDRLVIEMERDPKRGKEAPKYLLELRRGAHARLAKLGEDLQARVSTKPARKIPDVPPLGESVRLSTTIVDQVLLKAFISGEPTRLEQPQGAIEVQFRPIALDVDAVDSELTAKLHELVAKMDERDFDTWVTLSANWALNKDRDGGAWITRKAILDARGLQPKTKAEGHATYRAGHQLKNLDAANASMERLQTVILKLENVEAYDAKGNVSKLNFRSRAIAVTDDISQSSLALDGQEQETVQAWYYQLGKWARRLGPDDRFTHVPRAILELDPKRERWAKRIAWFLSIELRVNAKRSGPLRRRVSTFLENLRLGSDKDPERDRRALRKALDKCVEIGAIGGWRYENGCDTEKRENEILPARGANSVWKTWMVLVDPPEHLIPAREQLAARSAAKKRPAIAKQRRSARLATAKE